MRKMQPTAQQAFGKRLAQERRHRAVAEERDVSQKDVAKALSVSESTLSRWEAGEVMPRDKILERLAKYFGVTPAWLRYGQGPRLDDQTVTEDRKQRTRGHGDADERTGT